MEGEGREEETIRVSEKEWSLYFGGGFSDSEGSAESPELEAVAHICRRLRPVVTRESLRGSRTVPLNFEQLISRVGATFRTLFVDHPSTAMPCLALAVHKLLAADGEQLDDGCKVTVRLYEFGPQTPLTQLKSNLLGKMVCIRGSVIRAGFIRPMVTALPFLCRKCGTRLTPSVACPDGCLPDFRGVCPVCKGQTFVPMREEAQMDDFQIVRIQEELDGESGAGRVPRTIDCELFGDLVDACAPGDQVTVVGVLRMRLADDAKQVRTPVRRGGGSNSARGRGRGARGGGGGGDATEANSQLDVYVQVNSIDNKKQVDTGRRETMDFSEKDLEAVRYIHEQPKLFSLIVNSIAPAIFGHDLVKAGLALALFGGTQSDSDETTAAEKFSRKAKGFLPVRGDSHILVVGDPGMGKSQMLQAVNTISPRGVYVCGTYASARGLTVSLNREAGTSDYALEAGALVLGDQGVCLLDEFDKMDISEHQSLLEAMEQQSISIAKAGVVCTLPARTSVIAAANPVGGHYKFVFFFSNSYSGHRLLFHTHTHVLCAFSFAVEEKQWQKTSRCFQHFSLVLTLCSSSSTLLMMHTTSS